MNRLIKIAINLAIGSIMPIICWFCIGVILDKNLVNIFSVTYPLQFLSSLLLHIFGTGANISKEKDNNKSAVTSGLLIGTFIIIIIFGAIALNTSFYLKFMNYDIVTYKIFTRYSILFFGINSIFNILMEKLYFEGKESKATKFCIGFNLLTFIVLIGSAIVTHNQLISTCTTLIMLSLYTLLIFIKLFEKTKILFDIKNNIKYESSTICSNILFLLIFLFGLRNANGFGPEYIAAINFIALITDTQWDALDAVTTIAKIDISKGKFNHKKHLINAYKLTGIMVFTSILMFFSLYKQYNVDLVLALKYFAFELFNFLIWVKYATDNILIQLTYSTVKSTTIKIIANIMRFIISLFPTPFCTALGQVVSAAIQFIGYETITIRKKLYFKYNK